jgi:enoyl-CoA hydratase/carnithine racemase
MGKNLVLTEKQDMIGVITLNRPEAMNTFNVPFARALNDALLGMDQDNEVRVVVIRAAGKHFSTGISLPEFQGKSPKELREFLSIVDEFYHTLPRMKKPVIASVKGAAVANGAGLVFACDLAVAAENSRFGTTAINVGLICLGPAVPLARHVGRKKALEMILTGDIISAAEAQQFGLINKVVAPDDLEAETMKLAAKIAKKSPQAVQTGKIGVYAMSEIPYHQAVDYMDELFSSLCATEDAIEGVNAFMEKREPVWKGC